MYVCKCGREFEKSQSYIAHCGHCNVHLGCNPVDRFGDSRAWSRGRTKETDERVKKMSEHLSAIHQGENAPFYGKHHTQKTKEKMSNAARHNAKNNLNGWKAGNCRNPNKYESFTKKYLIDNEINFTDEVSVSKTSLGLKAPSRYILDFVVDDKIDLEIDGSSHDAEHDAERDRLVSNKFYVYRIQHHDSLDELKSKLDEFLEFLKTYQN